MEKLYKKIVNVETGEEITREFTKEEYVQFQTEQELFLTQRAEAEAAKATIEAKKQEVLAKLGLTSDEVAALLA